MLREERRGRERQPPAAATRTGPLRILILVAAVLAGAAAMGADENFRLQIGSEVRDGHISVTPSLSGPSGAEVSYEMLSSKSGSSGKSTTRQSGRARIDAGGKAALSSLRLGINSQDRYEITVRVFSAGKVVAEESFRHPQ